MDTSDIALSDSTILVIDDEENMRHMLQKMLEQTEFVIVIL